MINTSVTKLRSHIGLSHMSGERRQVADGSYRYESDLINKKFPFISLLHRDA